MYTQLINFKNDKFHSTTARTVDDAQKLVEAGSNTFATSAKSSYSGDENKALHRHNGATGKWWAAGFEPRSNDDIKCRFFSVLSLQPKSGVRFSKLAHKWGRRRTTSEERFAANRD